jgi:carboxyl-terminal processing protease
LQQEGHVGFLIMDVTAGGPAEEAGLQADDLLIQVAGTDIREMTAEEVRNLVRGKEGTFVDMTVLRKGEVRTISVERRKVQTPVATWEMLQHDVGLVTIENFDDRCAEETIQAIETLLENGAGRLIFDVRNNPGGYAH